MQFFRKRKNLFKVNESWIALFVFLWYNEKNGVEVYHGFE